ncbi:putative monooxygenase fad-binding protein [Phaeomoniella chlamydospora]|uniref:Putative monooxygenase fad-binding protein n=1 Tax=Phaeomoniella chlamydospora TaxID=158046 RepID=A0A0G2EXL6_PHACM|nr:putative monooxygenase fad-binding protein [Phaeomoniella chlamydospora]
MIARLRKTLRIPDLPVDLISLSHWNVNAVFAERYRVGRAFLVGDASHKIPPWGALGMNSGIQDVQNLVWKIALALKDEAKYDKLLDSYDIERRPIGEAACRSSLHNLLSHGNIMDVALGMDPEKSPEENTESITAFFDPSHSEYSERRSAVAQAQKILDTEFKAPGTEAGWFYPSADIDHEGTRNLHDGQLLPDGSLNYEFHCPSTIPGHNLPHAWLERDGQRVAIRDLISLDKLILFSNALSWDDLNTDERVYIEHIGTGAGCWTDKENTMALPNLRRLFVEARTEAEENEYSRNAV